MPDAGPGMEEMVTAADSPDRKKSESGDDYGPVPQGVAIHDRRAELVVCDRNLVAMLDLPERLTRAGTPLIDMLGHARGNAEGGTDGPDQSANACRAALLADDNGRCQVRTADGRTLQISRSMLPDGGFTLVYRDTFGRRAVERHARHQALVIEQMEEIVIVTDLEQRITDINRAGERLTGFKKGELLHLKTKQLLPRNERLGDMNLRIEREGSWRGELELRKMDGTVLYLDTVILLLTDEDGAEVGRVGIARDVTRLRRREIELRNSETQFQNLTDASVQGVLIHQGGKIVYANHLAAKILEYGDRELIGIKPFDLVAPEDRAMVRGFRKLAEVGPVEIRRLTKDGRTIWTDSISRKVMWHGKPARQVAMSDITPRKQAQKDLRRQSFVMEQIDEAVLITDLDRRLVFINPGAQRLWDITAEEALGRISTELFNTDLDFDNVLKSFEEKGIWRGEIKIRRKVGEPLHAETTIRPLTDDQGRRIGIVGVSRDITERRRASQALRESEAKFRNLIEGSLQGVLIHDEGRIIYVNQAMADIFKRAVDDLIGREAKDLIAPEDLRKMAREREAGQNISHFQVRGLRPDGSIVWMDTSGRDVEWDGKPARQVISVDITERRRGEEALRRQAVVLSLLEEAVVITDLERGIVDCNPATEQIFGYARAELIGENAMRFLIDPETWKGRAEMILDHVERFGRWSGEVDFRRRDGAAITGEVVLAPLFTDSGERVGTSVVVHDITKAKKAGRELRRAREEAILANAAKSRFLAAASHDLRQPVQALRLLVEALTKSTRPGDIPEIIEEIKTCTLAMDGLLSAVLDISRLEAGVIKPEIQIVSADHLLTALVREFAPRAQRKGLDLRFVTSRAGIRTDPGLLQRIVRNFLSNAIGCTAEGKVLVGCRRRGDSLGIEVWDTGIGIPAGETRRIFMEFHQLGNPERNAEKGLGLGLAIAKGSASLLGHDITMRSTPGRGSVFTVEVPMAPLEDDVEAVARPPVASRSRPAGQFIVLVENERIVALAVARLLELWGYEVATFENVEQAMAQIESLARAPAAVIADYSLSADMNGGHFIKFVQDRFSADIPGVILTGDTSPERLREAESLGYHLLHKPASSDQIKSLLDDILPV